MKVPSGALKFIVVQPKYIGDLRSDEVLEKHLAVVKEVIKEDADAFVFPETFLGKLTNERMNELQDIAGSKTIITGGVRYENGLYNSAFIITKDSIKIHDKVTLWLDEAKYFVKGNKFEIFNVNNIKTAIFICADFLDPSYGKHMYNKKALDSLSEKPKLIIVPSFALKNKLNKWCNAFKTVSKIYNIKIIFSNYKGKAKENNLIYGGGKSGFFVNGKKVKLKLNKKKNYDYFVVKF